MRSVTRAVTIVLMIAGSFSGGLAIALMLGGWVLFVPYPLVAAGVFYLAAAIAGFISRR
jgi:hypothetical protein